MPLPPSVHPFPLQDFYQKECWAHHPKPHQEYIDARKKQVGWMAGWLPIKKVCSTANSSGRSCS